MWPSRRSRLMARLRRDAMTQGVRLTGADDLCGVMLRVHGIDRDDRSGPTITAGSTP